MATTYQVESFRRSLAELGALMRAEIEDLWATLDAQNPRALSLALQDILPDLVTEYGEIAAVLAADYYDELMDDYGLRVAPAALAASADPEAVKASARWAVGPLFGAKPSPEDALEHLVSAATRQSLQPARDTIHNNAAEHGVSYARVPSGRETCAWCHVLASQGAVYGSARSAKYDAKGEKYHDDCDCVPTPVRGPSDYPKGYDPEALEKMYEDAMTGDLSETLSNLRTAHGLH